VTTSSLVQPRVPLLSGPTPVQEVPRLRAALGGGPTLLVKRDDAIPFGFGGNKVRKLEFVLAEAVARGADTLVTVGGVQSNHARATAAAAASLGLQCVLILNGLPPAHPTANALLDRLLGAEIEYIESRAARTGASERVMRRLRAEGRRPFFVPLHCPGSTLDVYAPRQEEGPVGEVFGGMMKVACPQSAGQQQRDALALRQVRDPLDPALRSLGGGTKTRGGEEPGATGRSGAGPDG